MHGEPGKVSQLYLTLGDGAHLTLAFGASDLQRPFHGHMVSVIGNPALRNYSPVKWEHCYLPI